MNVRTLELEALLKLEGRQLDPSALESNDVIVIPEKGGDKSLLSIDDITVIKKLKGSGKKVYIVNHEQYKEFRGGEWELALQIITGPVKDLVIGLASAWLYDKIKSYNEARQEIKTRVEQPKIRIRYYFEKSKKYVEIEGDAEAATKALESLRKDDTIE